jgi:hypothetical protein
MVWSFAPVPCVARIDNNRRMTQIVTLQRGAKVAAVQAESKLPKVSCGRRKSMHIYALIVDTLQTPETLSPGTHLLGSSGRNPHSLPSS